MFVSFAFRCAHLHVLSLRTGLLYRAVASVRRVFGIYVLKVIFCHMLFELNLNRLHECSPILPGEKNQQNKTNPKKVSLPKYLGLLKGI